MKAPEIKALDYTTPSDPFLRKVEEVKQQGSKTKPKTYSLPEKDISYIDKVAMELGKARGKVVSSSEALRVIIEKHAKG